MFAAVLVLCSPCRVEACFLSSSKLRSPTAFSCHTPLAREYSINFPIQPFKRLPSLAPLYLKEESLQHVSFLLSSFHLDIWKDDLNDATLIPWLFKKAIAPTEQRRL